MHSSPLLPYFLSQNFSPQHAQAVADAFRRRELKRGQLFVEQGFISRHLAYIERGFLQYFIVLDGLEKTTYSAGTGQFAASLVSFLRQVAANENIRALVDCTLWTLDRDALLHLRETIPPFQKFYVAVLEEQLCCLDESRYDALMLTATERYRKMLAKTPELVQNIPVQDLASILGVTPRHLSRLRHQLKAETG